MGGGDNRPMTHRTGHAALVVVALLTLGAAGTDSLQDARRALADGRLDDIYLSLGGTKRGGHPAGDQAVAALLCDAAEKALAADDPTLALALTDSARRLAPEVVRVLLLNATAAERLDQRAGAEEALEAALRLAPNDPEVVWRRAVFAEAEGELEKARALLRRIPATHRRSAEARTRERRIAEELAARAAELQAIRRDEEAQRAAQALAGRMAGTGTSSSEAVPLGGEGAGAIAGVATAGGALEATRESDHFRLRYSPGVRDFAERARYEARVEGLFERAWQKVAARLGRRPARRIDVLLCTEEEFRTFYAPIVGNGVLGFYSGAIVMNLANDPNEGFFATTVHEITHAFIDALVQGRPVPTWLHEGLATWIERAETGGDYIGWGEKQQLRALREAKRLPPMRQLSERGFAGLGALAGVAYAKSSAAIETIVGGPGGLAKLVGVLEAVGDGTDFEAAFARAYGERRLERLDADVDALLGK